MRALRQHIDRSLYRAGLFCCPPAFRRDYGAEMLRDFDEARTEACSTGRVRDLWAWRLSFSLDLIRTAAAEWVRSGFPLVVLAALPVPLLLAGGAMNLLRGIRFSLSPDTPDAESIGLVLLSSVVVVLVAMTILFTTWAARSVRPRPRTRCFKRVP
jgi:hypothetical protein